VSEVAVILQGLGAAFTAGTAYLALRSVRLNERQWRTATEPDVHLEVLSNARTGTTDLALMNVGGTSRATCFAVSVGGNRAFGYVGDGFLKSGERVYIHCELPQAEDTKALLLFRGMDETSYARARGALRSTLSTDRNRPPTTFSQEWERVYPGETWLASGTLANHVVTFPDRLQPN